MCSNTRQPTWLIGRAPCTEGADTQGGTVRVSSLGCLGQHGRVAVFLLLFFIP